MFTIKHSTDELHRIFSGHEVTYRNNSEDIANSLNPEKLTVVHRVTVKGSDGRVTDVLDEGLVYVMNDRGSTVAKYDLDPLI
jgi:hypothetical protein